MPKNSRKTEESPIFSVAYCSRAIKTLRAEDIDNIVRAARAKNSLKDITGWLVYGSGIFFQWLEGSREHVKYLMAAITIDRRHDTVVILSESEDIEERLFSGWDMELVSADDIRDVLVEALSESSDPKNRAALRKLVKEVDSQGLKPWSMKDAIDL